MMTDAKRALGATEKLDWLRLLRSENVGPVTSYKLLKRFGTATAALDALPELANKSGARSIKVASRAAAEKELQEINQRNAHLIARTEPAYPPLLSCLEDAPPLIIVMGHAHFLKKTVSIIGTRNASITGVRLAHSFAASFGEAGFLVASGLARGIDTVAHQGALATGTVAIVAGGADIIYPRENDELCARIVDQGAELSEIPLGTAPQARHFPRRNR
jgi:DNA processing protein